jgi:prepilin-type N-terminal cleavage/methylation domain-containing protein
MNRQRGFNLMELMVTLGLAAVIIGIGAPNFEEFRANSRLTGVANDYLGAMLSARTEALKRQAPVALCPSDNPDSPDAECSDGAFTGWITFVDTNNDCLRDEDDDEILRAQPVIDEAVLTDSNGVCLSFAANGFRQVIAGRATVTRTVFCDERGNNLIAPASTDSFARGIEVQPTGRGAIVRNRVTIASWSGAFGVACP